jgi:hypothetical protein
MESMGKTLLNLFRSYCSQLLKLELLMAGKNDLIAVEEATLKSVFTQKVSEIDRYPVTHITLLSTSTIRPFLRRIMRLFFLWSAH